jgi:hypothetical protein
MLRLVSAVTGRSSKSTALYRHGDLGPRLISIVVVLVY